jgi:curved DNA-binding protein CbpA
MSFPAAEQEAQTYYDILEVPPTASAQEIRAAYLRMKSAYRPENIAHYALFSEEESRSLLSRIEEAHQVLSHPERRKEYDQKYGLIEVFEEISTPGNVIPIERSPERVIEAPIKASAPQTLSTLPHFSNDPVIDSWIENETSFNGEFWKRIREARCVTLEELSDYTKINRKYLRAIEEEDFKKLPAPVFVRGFITQIARYLKIPAEKSVPAYLSRIKKD